MTDGIMAAVLDKMKAKAVTKRSVYNFLEISPSTLDGYFSGKYPISLNDYIKLCKLLELNPSFFFEANHTTNLVKDSTVQYATGKEIKQKIESKHSPSNDSEILRVENEGLKKENALLREMIEMYKSK